MGQLSETLLLPKESELAWCDSYFSIADNTKAAYRGECLTGLMVRVYDGGAKKSVPPE